MINIFDTVRKIKMDKDTVFSEKVILKLIEDHQKERNRILEMKKYYNNMNDILNRSYTDSNKPQNKLSHNYAAYITDNFVGYMVGKPISYKSHNKDLLDKISESFLYNDEIDNNTTLAQEQSICGYAYELLYTDNASDLRFKCLDTENTIVVYDNSLEEAEIFAILYNELDKDKLRIYTYDNNSIKEYIKENDKLTLKLGSEHFFGQVPISTYENNRQRIGDFEKAISIINAYDKAESDTANDFEYFTNAILMIKGVLIEEEDEKGKPLNFKENRVLNFSGMDGDAGYLIKNINDTALENYKNRLNKDIHKFSNVVDMSDENFAGNLSGIAIKYKLLTMENATAIKESKFRKGIMKRIELMTIHFKIANNSDFTYLDIKPIFTRNIPSNDTETVTMVRDLTGIVSNETLLSQLPFVEDVEAEIKAIDKEKEKEFGEYEINPKHE
ncbi:phage portal protein (plasmid) [Paraclostridium ghonii]|uniref:phage portal protein n=1 Tax=Paraclostridium ghonii TaxID=29358 RepID=UPI00202D0A02|nr:phage portal protein [Paeniclostridium ghonii]MCM0167588.1 phage portal protein [Paeniclostridium ghonii]